jgi:hypothetical protein
MAELGDHIQNNPDTDYEQSDFPIGAIGLALLGIFVFLVIAPFVLMAAFPRAASDVSRAPTVEPPAPRLQIDPSEDLGQFRAKEQKQLDTYYWIDKQKGVVHIPIEQAMKKLAEQGIDGFPRGQP